MLDKPERQPQALGCLSLKQSFPPFPFAWERGFFLRWRAPSATVAVVLALSYSSRGLSLTKGFEGLVLTAYRDVTGTWTIGYGHTGSDVVPGLVWTQEQADAALLRDIQYAVNAVNLHCANVNLNQNQFDALVDFTYNEGVGNFATSHLLLYLKNDDFQSAVMEFHKWDVSKGKVLDGLERRRQAEADLFASTT